MTPEKDKESAENKGLQTQAAEPENSMSPAPAGVS